MRWGNRLLRIEVTCSLADFREFMIQSTCRTYITDDLYQDPEIFPERLGTGGVTYVEAEDKETKGTAREIRFVRAKDVFHIVYTSKSGNTRLTWSRIEGTAGKLKGEASLNSVVNLIANHVLDESYLNAMKAQTD